MILFLFECEYRYNVFIVRFGSIVEVFFFCKRGKSVDNILRLGCKMFIGGNFVFIFFDIKRKEDVFYYFNVFIFCIMFNGVKKRIFLISEINFRNILRYIFWIVLGSELWKFIRT